MKKIISFVGAMLVAASVVAESATLVALKGPVLLQSAPSRTFIPIEAGQKLERRDRVRVGPGGVAHILFTSGDTLLVKENSDFLLEQNRRGTVVSFDVGEFLIGLKRKLTKGHRFQIQTPAGIAGVRGTSFWGKTDADKNAAFACFTGSVEITAADKTVLLAPGETLTVVFGKAPSDPQPAQIPADFINTFSVGESLQGIDTIIKNEQ